MNLEEIAKTLGISEPSVVDRLAALTSIEAWKRVRQWDQMREVYDNVSELEKFRRDWPVMPSFETEPTVPVSELRVEWTSANTNVVNVNGPTWSA